MATSGKQLQSQPIGHILQQGKETEHLHLSGNTVLLQNCANSKSFS
uniref:Uncharacterized protein n=1 Tax=Arundo donax TaxID=35708 RepID=A0A0A9AIK0_ARUDO